MVADRITEVLLIAHGECAASLRADLVGGRWTEAAGLTSNGERQARALAVFLKSQGVRFDEVYSSPLDRARATSALVCRGKVVHNRSFLKIPHWQELRTPGCPSVI